MDNLLDLAALSLALGREPRATLHPDGVTSETVATHSHMLTMVACTVAAQHPDRFDIGLVAQFATVHDVPEVAPGGPGDLDTFTTTDDGAIAARDAAEDAAIARLVKLHPGWLGDLCVRYRDQREPEARLVRYLDKVLPKLTLALGGAAQFRRDGHTAEYFERFVAKQGAALREQYPELAELCGAIYDAGNDLVREAMPPAPGRYRDTDGVVGTLSGFDAFANRYTFTPDGTKPPAVLGPGVPYPYRHLGPTAVRRLVPVGE